MSQHVRLCMCVSKVLPERWPALQANSEGHLEGEADTKAETARDPVICLQSEHSL